MILKKFKKEKDMTELAVQKKTLTPEQKKKRKKRIIAGVAVVVIVGFAECLLRQRFPWFRSALHR